MKVMLDNMKVIDDMDGFDINDFNPSEQVGDKTIRRWCVSMNIPDKKSVIRTFSDEDWDKI